MKCCRTGKIHYIVRLAYGRKVDKDSKRTRIDVKSKTALQSLVEDVIFYHVNGLKLPDITLTDVTQTAIDKMHIADAKPATAA